MKTKGTIYARAKKVLFLFAEVTSAIPVLAQVNSSLRENTSFTTLPNLPQATFTSYYSLAGSASNGHKIGQIAVFSSLSDKSDSAAAETDYSGKPDDKLSSDETSKKLNTDNLVIRFRPTSFTYPVSCGRDMGIPEYPTTKLLLYATVLKRYAKQNGFDTTYAFLSNMGMLYDKKRFVVVNLVTMEIEQSGLVSQGRGQGRSKFDKQYSNTVESKCTSLGRYKITNKYKGAYGESYRMTGLDSSNHNAYKRNIVLHSMGCIPDEENVMSACVSEGCPAVSMKFLSSLSKIIDTRKKPVLLWVFDSNLEEVIVEEIKSEKKYHTCSIHRYDSPDVE